MKRRNLIIGGSIFFLVFLAIVYNIPEERTKEEQQKSISVEQVKQDSLRIARVNSATAKAESLARVRNKVLPYSKTIPINQTPVTSPVRSEEEIVTERYADLIDEYGRDRAGTMIQTEIKDAWEDDRTRAAMLINASATAMQGDYERPKVQVVKTVSWDELQIGRTYRVSKQTMLMPEGRNPSDPMNAIGRIKKMPTGTRFLVVGVDRDGQPWYEVRVGSDSGWINGIALVGQDLTESK